jgi:hypothetical protein
MLMKKALSVVALVFVFPPGRCDIQAQTEAQNFEVGFHYTAINLRAFNSKETGVGLRFSYNLNNYLTFEVEGNLFEFSVGDHPTDDFLGAQGLLGIKTGLRNRRIGIFAKARSGVVNFPKLRVHPGLCFIGQTCDGSGRSGNRWAVDAGAVVELYPTEKIIVRIDIGDTMIRFRDDVFFKSSGLVRINDGFSHNFQLAGGLSFRF